MNVGIVNDRAWNDPPPLPFSDCQSSSAKRTTLNKRVAFPLHKPDDMPSAVGNENSDRKATVENMIPLVPCPPAESNSAVCSDLQTTEDCPRNDVTDEEMLLTITSTFETLINSFALIPQKNIEDIKRKIAVFSDSWKHKLSPTVKQKMYGLATELSAGNIEAANKLHQNLIVNNIREVTPWMVGVKHIIQNAQKNAPENVDGEKDSKEAQILDACTFHPDSGFSFTSS